MDTQKNFDLEHLMKSIRVVQKPGHLLATFAVTDIAYYFVSPVTRHSCRLRRGTVKAEKPSIIHPQMTDEVFEGFDDDIKRAIDRLGEMMGTDLRMLGYRFRNELTGNAMEHQPADVVIERLKEELKEKPRTTIITGAGRAWQIGLLKVILEHAGHSFPANLRELEEHGFFPGKDGLPDRTRWRIDALFRKARKDPGAVKELGGFLNQHGLFHDYEDRFFALLGQHRKTS